MGVPAFCAVGKQKSGRHLGSSHTGSPGPYGLTEQP